MIATILLAIGSPVMLMGFTSLKTAENEFAAQNFGEASRQFQRAARFIPWRTDLWEQAGISEYGLGDYSSAIDFLNRARELSEAGWLVLGDSYFYLEDVQSAQETYQSGLKYFDSPRLYAHLAITYREQKDWDGEKAALENQLRLDSEDAFVHYRLGLLYSLFDPKLALSELTAASSLNPEVDSAAQTLISALNLASTQSDSSMQMVAIGRALGLVQEWELAKAAFEKATHTDAENAEAWAWLGEAKQQLGQNGAGELDRALSINHLSPVVRGLRALYWNRQEKYEQMLAEYLLAAEYEPDNPVWRASLADAYSKNGDLVSALAAYQAATELAPTDATYWRLLAFFCSNNGVHVEDIGLPAAIKAAELAPENPNVLDVLGYTYYASGRYASAEQVLTNLIKAHPDHYPAYIHLAMTNLTQGNNTSAYDNLVFVRDNDPSGDLGELALELLAQYFP